MKSAFLPSKGLLCLYDKQNNTWLLVDMEFLFSCSTRHLAIELNARREIPYLRAPMYYSLFIGRWHDRIDTRLNEVQKLNFFEGQKLDVSSLRELPPLKQINRVCRFV